MNPRAEVELIREMHAGRIRTVTRYCSDRLARRDSVTLLAAIAARVLRGRTERQGRLL